MRIPTIRGVIDRRILANFRVEPATLADVLPAPFRPQVVDGYGIAGICLIRLIHIGPRWWPAALGISSENAAHRIAVEWDTTDGLRTGVYIPRRDTSSRLNAIAGGRIFPGQHHLARFVVTEAEPHFRVEMESYDRVTKLAVDGTISDSLPPDSVFASVDDVSQFFEAGSLGYSPAITRGKYDGLELRSFNWHVEPLEVTSVESSYFSDPQRFPPGTVNFDNALLMRGITHEWHQRDELCCTASEPRPPVGI